jgi:hypothetical protein
MTGRAPTLFRNNVRITDAARAPAFSCCMRLANVEFTSVLESLVPRREPDMTGSWTPGPGEQGSNKGNELGS